MAYTGTVGAPDEPETLANTALIAAAPDLLHACIEAYHCLTNGAPLAESEHPESPYHFLFNAIAKAKGDK